MDVFWPFGASKKDNNKKKEPLAEPEPESDSDSEPQVKPKPDKGELVNNLVRWHAKGGQQEGIKLYMSLGIWLW